MERVGEGRGLPEGGGVKTLQGGGVWDVTLMAPHQFGN